MTSEPETHYPDFSKSMTSIRRRLDQIDRLRPGWLDGYGEKISASAISDAHALALHCSLLPLDGPSITPVEDGDVQLECYREGANMEIIFHGAEHTECFYIDLIRQVQIVQTHDDLRGTLGFLQAVQDAL